VVRDTPFDRPWRALFLRTGFALPELVIVANPVETQKIARQVNPRESRAWRQK
jgi:hypothetical protein